MTGSPQPQKPPALPFSNDGSFMELFAKMQREKEQQEKEAAAAAAGGAEAEAPPPPPPTAEAETAAAAQGRSSGGKPSSEGQQEGGSARPPGQQQAGTAQDPSSESARPAAAAAAATAGRASSGDGGAAAASRPRSAPTAPAVVLKAKKSIVQVRTRSGEALQPGSSKRAKKEEKSGTAAADEPQSFYLKELQRYRQAACEGSSGDRPLVK